MQVIKDTGSVEATPARVMTREAMQQDFEFEMAENITRSLLEKGFITAEEKDRISTLNREKFSPFYGDIMDK